jgi:hypothetical protein
MISQRDIDTAKTAAELFAQEIRDEFMRSLVGGRNGKEELAGYRVSQGAAGGQSGPVSAGRSVPGGPQYSDNQGRANPGGYSQGQ